MISRLCERGVWISLVLVICTIPSVTSENDKCDSSLGMEDGRITDAMIQTSSDQTGTNKTGVRYNCCTEDSSKSWCPDKDKVWVEIDFPEPTGVSGVAIQFPSEVTDPKKAQNYLETYHLLYKPVGRPNLEYLGNNGVPANITGSSDKLPLSRMKFEALVMEKLRIEAIPSTGKPCFRFELYGCDVKSLCPEGCDNGHCAGPDRCECDSNFKGKFCEEPVIPKSACHVPLGMDSGNITSDQITVSSTKPGHDKDMGRWGCCVGEHIGAWCPADNDTEPYYQVTFPKPVTIGTIGIQYPARQSENYRVTTYMDTYSIAVRPTGSKELFEIPGTLIAANSTTQVSTSFGEPFVTDQLRILPKTWNRSACFRMELYTCDTEDQCPIGCKNKGACIGSNKCHCQSGYFGVDCSYTKKEIKMNLEVSLTFSMIVGKVLITPAYNLSLHGHPQLVDGRLGKALYLNGNSQYMVIRKQNMGCLANVGRCHSGFTLSMDINFVSIEEGVYIFSSGGDDKKTSGMTCRVHQSNFVVTVSTATQIWEGQFSTTLVSLHEWTKFEFSWSLTDGLYVYLNNGHQAVVSVTRPTDTHLHPVYQSSNLVFGASTVKTSVYAHYTIENYKTWYISKKELVTSGVIDAKCPDSCLNNGNCTTEGNCKCPDGFEGKLCEIKKNQLTKFNLEFISEATVNATTSSGLWTVEGGPKFINTTTVGMSVGIISYKHHLILQPRPDNPCLSNIDLCFKGITYHMELNVHRWANSMYILSNGGEKSGTYGVAFFYALDTLLVTVSTTTHMWTVKFPSLPKTNVWHSIEYSWSQVEGLTVYMNNTRVGMTQNGTETEVTGNQTFPIRIGTPTYVTTKVDGSSFEIADIHIWLTTRTILENFHILEVATLPVTTPIVTTEKENVTADIPTTTHSTKTTLHTEKAITTLQATTTITEAVTEIKSSESAAAKATSDIITDVPSTKPSTTRKMTHLPDTTTQLITSAVTVKQEELPVSKQHNYTWSFANIQSHQISVVHNDVNLTLTGGSKFVTIDSHKAIKFQSSTRQFVEFSTDHRSCLNDISLCHNGFTVTFNIKLISLEENTYILSTGGENPISTGLAILYRFGRLQFVFSHNMHAWYCHTPRPSLSTWTTIDVTWHVDTGLEVYSNNVLKDHSNTPIKFVHSHSTVVHKHFYFASSTTYSNLQQNFDGYLSSFSTWFSSRVVLVQEGILKPGIIATPATSQPTKQATTSTPTTTPTTSTAKPATSTAAPTTTTTVAPTTKPPTTAAPTTTSPLPVTTPGELTCPTGCVKKDQVATEKPQKPDKPSLTIETPEILLRSRLLGSTYFVCKFRSSEQANLLHTVRWFIGGKELLMSKQVLHGSTSMAKLDPAKLTGTLLNKEICCSIQNQFTGICGSKFSEEVKSNCITPEIKLLTSKLTIHEGAGSSKIRVNITVPPSALCSVETGYGCEVRILATLVSSTHDRKCSSHALPQVVFLPHLSGSRYHSCGASFINTNWKETMEIELKATIDGVYDRNQIRQVKLSVKIVGVMTLSLIQIGVIQVTIIDGDRRALCSSVGDPHITTYDGQRYNNYLEGELIMYTHDTRPYEVRAKLKRCSSRRLRPTCNCGIAVRAGDDVITLSRCDSADHHHDDHHHHHSSSSMAIQLYMNGVLTSGTTVRRLGCGQKYEVYLPTGTKITVQTVSTSFINFWITPSAADRNHVRGLCGTYNSNRGDDYTGPTGTSYSKYLRNSQPDTYIAAWRMTESIFTGVAMLPQKEQQRYCHCYNPEHAPCGITYDIATCTTKSSYDITAELIKQARAPRLLARRHKRAAPDPVSTSPSPQECTNSSWTEESATAYCQEYLDNSTAAMKCNSHFNLSSEQRLKDCAVDLQCTDNVVYARSMIDDVISHCVEEAQKQVPVQGNDTTTSDIADLVKSLCVEICQNAGSCMQGVCLCADGFTGVDCSIGKNSTPIVDPIPQDGEPCDIQGDNCQFAPVTGDDFVNTEDLKCHLTYVQIKDTVASTSQTEIVNATYLDISRVNCPIYQSQSVQVKVTNNGRVFSQQSYLHVVYDSKCSICRLDRNTNTAVCHQRDDICRIDGQCYNNGQTKVKDNCSVCDITQSKAAWSDSKALECKETVSAEKKVRSQGVDRTAKIIIGVVCGVVGLCIIFVSIYLYRRRSSHAKPQQLTTEPTPDPSHTVELHRERTDMIKPMIYTNQAFVEESIRS